MKRILFFLLAAIAVCAETLPDRLAELDQAFDDSFSWWAQVYDPDTGGTYYGLSAKHARTEGDTRFGPDIEAAGKLLGVCADNGLLKDQRLDPFKASVVHYLQQLQDPDSGFFRDPQFRDEYTPKLLDRAAGMAAKALRLCDGKPLYSLPLDRRAENAEAASHFQHLESPEAFADWLAKQPWDGFIWSAGSNLRSQSGNFSALPDEQRETLLKALERFLESQQQENGYFGKNSPDDVWYSKLSGTYKIISFLAAQGRPIPRAAEIKASVFKDLEERRYNNSIVLYNTANIMSILDRNGQPLTEAEKLHLLKRCTEMIYTFKTPDGGFGTYSDKPCPVEMNRRLGLNVTEGNTNASGLLYTTRNILYRLVTGKSDAPPHPRSGELLEALAGLSTH